MRAWRDAGRWLVALAGLLPLTPTGAGWQAEPVAALALPKTTSAGAPLGGLSGLVWHAADARLIAVSDRGRLHHFSLQRDAAGVVQAVVPMETLPLRDASQRPLTGAAADAEDLALLPAADGAPNLLVAFERQPRLLRYDLTGRWLGPVELPPPFAEAGRYDSGNHQLEALLATPDGWLAGVERPLRGERQVALLDARGRRGGFEPDGSDCGLVALAELPTAAGQPAGLLALERCFRRWPPAMRLVLRELQPDASGDWHDAGVIAQLTHAEIDIDNFEGIARIGPHDYLLVSDDNFQPVQRNLLLQIRLTPDDR